MDYSSDLAFLFYNPTRVVFGEGSSGDVAMELAALGSRRALLVTDRFLFEHTDVVKKIEKTLGNACAGVFSDVPADSGVHVIDAAAELGRSRGADSVVSVGGGSVIDTAKGVAILLREGGSLLDYQGFQLLTRPQTPHIAVPTTAGTGSEVTCYAVVKDHEKKRKLLFGDHHIIPNVAILDPALTVGLPPVLTAATGLDAFSHGLEALTSAQREPVADALGLHAIRLVAAHLPAAVKNGSDTAARGQMLAAATLGGAAFSNAQVGLVHAIAHVIGARHGVHHGTANAIAMPHVMRFDNDTVAGRYRMVAEAMGVDVRGLSDEAGARRAADAVRDFCREVGLPGSFRAAGVPESDLAACAEAALSDGAIVYNAKPVTDAAEVLGVLKKAWAGEGMSDAAVPSVRLAPGAEEAGLAAMLADLVRLNLAQDPRKRRDFDRLEAVVVIEARDAGIAITMRFARGTLTVHAEAHPAPQVRIAADSRTILELARLKIVLGLPMVFGRQGRALLREMLDGSIRISPVRGNLGTLLRLTRLLSVHQ